MRLTAEELHRLDEYLLGRGSGEEREYLREKLDADPDWQAAAREQQQLIRQLRFATFHEQLKGLQEIEKN